MMGMMLAAALAMNNAVPDNGPIVFTAINGRVMVSGSGFEAVADRAELDETKTTLELEGREGSPAAISQVDSQTRERVEIFRAQRIHFKFSAPVKAH